MTRMAITAGEQVLHADVVISSSQTGRRHYIRADGQEQRVPGRLVIPERGKVFKPVAIEPGSRDGFCTKCKERKPRKGGTNRGHRFICAECNHWRRVWASEAKSC